MSNKKPRLWPQGESVSWRDIVDMRGGVEPTKCDFCKQDKQAIELEPEEAGAWVCITCLARWEENERT